MTQDTQTPQQPQWDMDMSEFGGTRLVLKPEQFGQEVLFEHASFDEIHAVQAILTRLEGALREAEKDIAFIHEQHDEEAVRVYTQIFDLNAKLREAEAKAALADEAKGLMDGWRTPFVIGDGSADVEAEYERGRQRLLTATREWLAKYDALQQPKAGAS